MTLRKMAAPKALRPWRGLTRALSGGSPAPAPAPAPAGRLLRFLYDRFAEPEILLQWWESWKRRALRRQNERISQIRNCYGDDIAATHFVLSSGGSARFQDQEQWLRVGRNLTARLLPYLDDPKLQPVVVAIDLSGSSLTCTGLQHLVRLKHLEFLDLSACPHLDDWALSRLHPLGETLRHLSLARCPRITERGLACLHLLPNLQHLDLSELPAVAHQGLMCILLEEMLPSCQIVGLNEAPPLDGDQSQPGAGSH